MKNAFSIKFVGMAELIGLFKRMPNDLMSTINAGMREAAFAVEAAAKVRITTGPERAIKTGYLRASIGVSSVTAYRATVTANAAYGIYIHEGTRYMIARPFLEKGLYDAVGAIERIFGRRIQTLMKVS